MVSASGRVADAGGCPTIRAGIVSPAGVSNRSYSTPDDHFTAGPDCCVKVSASRRVRDAGGCPTIRAGIVSPASVRNSCSSVHPKRSFHCRSRLPCDSRPEGALVVLVAVQLSVLGLYLPPVFKCRWYHHIHPRRSFHCRSRLPCDRYRPAGALVVLVAVQLSVLGLYLPPVFNSCRVIISAPDDHFTAGPDCRVNLGRGRVGGAGGCPTIGAGIVSPAGVRIQARHHLHPRRSFHCRSRLPCDRLGQRARSSVVVAVQLSVLGLYLPPVFK